MFLCHLQCIIALFGGQHDKNVPFISIRNWKQRAISLVQPCLFASNWHVECRKNQTRGNNFFSSSFNFVSGSTLTPELFLWAFSQSFNKWCCDYCLLADFPVSCPCGFSYLPDIQASSSTHFHSYLSQFNQSLKWKMVVSHFISYITITQVNYDILNPALCWGYSNQWSFLCYCCYCSDTAS